MVTISKPLSAGQAQAYHRREFTFPDQSYYTQRDQIRGEWQGSLAAEWGLRGEVTEEQFARLANGQHPETGAELVRHRKSFEYKNGYGKTVKTMEHRAGWDATFSAPKSVSLTALVGGDGRVRDAHRESVRIAVDELERYVQARLGGNRAAETTGKWAVAKFDHDSARPVGGYSAPQLHTHVVFFQRDRVGGRDDARHTATRAVQEPAIRHQRLSVGNGCSPDGARIRSRRRKERRAQRSEVTALNTSKRAAHGVGRSERILSNRGSMAPGQRRSRHTERETQKPR